MLHTVRSRHDALLSCFRRGSSNTHGAVAVDLWLLSQCLAIVWAVLIFSIAILMWTVLLSRSRYQVLRKLMGTLLLLRAGFRSCWVMQ